MSKYKMRLKKGDQVRVISGKHKGSEGEITAVDKEKTRVTVRDVNTVKKTQRPTQQNPRGGFTEKEAPIHVSNVQLIDPQSGGPTRIRYEIQDSRKVRVSVKSGTRLDE